MKKTPRLAFSLKEASAALGISRRMLEKMIRAKEIRRIKIGRRSLIAVADLRKFLLQDHATPSFENELSDIALPPSANAVPGQGVIAK
jgi:excisionase family DNA binding protein